MGLFDHFPYTNVHELNLDWCMEQLHILKTTIEQFVSINALKYADPIQWNIVSQYEKNTIVIDPLTGTAYISVQPVPSGVSITNTDYWTVVFDLGSFVVRAAKNFTDKFEEETTLTATFPSNVNDWIIWGDVLYRVLSPIVTGDQYVIDSNIKHFTAEDVIGHIQDLNTSDKSNLVAAINELVQAIINEADRVNDITGDPDDLTTLDKSNLVAAINEIFNTVDTLVGNVSTISSDVDSLIDYVNHNATDTLYTELIQRISTKHYYADADEATEPAVYGSFQGLCNSKDNKYLAMLIPIEVLYNYTSGHITDLAEIVEFDADFNEIRRSNPIKLYHGRNITFYNDKIYVNGDMSGFTTVNKIVVVDYASLTVDSEISISDHGGGAVLFIKDGYLYTGSTTKIVKRELDGTAVEVIDISSKNLRANPHSIKNYKDGYLATYNNPNTIDFLDKDFNLIKSINMPEYLAVDGEIKDFATKDNDIFINQNGRSYLRLANGEYTEVYRNIFKVNLFKNVHNTTAPLSPLYAGSAKFNSRKVNGATTSTKQDGSDSNPFVSVMMAIHYGYKFIIIDDDGSEYYYLGGAADCLIAGNSLTKSKIYVDHISGATVSLRDIRIEEKLRNVEFLQCVVDLCHCAVAANITSRQSIFNTSTQAHFLETEGELSALTIPTFYPTVNLQKYQISNENGSTIPTSLTALADTGIYVANIRATYGSAVFVGHAVMIGAYAGSYFISLHRNDGGNMHTLLLSLLLSISGGVVSNSIYNATLDGTNVPASDISITRFMLVHLI